MVRTFETTGELTFLLRRTIRDHLRRSRPAPKNRETRVSLGPAASHLAAPPSPRHEQQCRTGS